MKLKILSLICAFGIFAFGTNAMAHDEMMLSGDALIDPAPAPNPTFCENNVYCTKPTTDKPNPKYNSTICSAICTGYTAAHDFITKQLCSDPAVDPKTTKSTSCKTLCGGAGATLNDLSCCLTQVGDNLSMTTKTKLLGICNTSFGTVDCPFLPIANYAGWLCCPREDSYIANCLKSAAQTPAWTCPTKFKPTNCPALSK